MKKIFIFFIIFLSSLAKANLPTIIDGVIKGGNNRSYGQISLFSPLYMPDDDQLLFGDIRLMHHLPAFKKNNLYNEKTYEINLGIGYRIAHNPELIIGSAFFYDLRRSQITNKLLMQATVNAHILSPTWQTQANLYVPIGKKEISKISSKSTGKGLVTNREVFLIYNQHKLNEKALTGFDLRISNVLSGAENMRIGSLLYYFSGKKKVAGGGIEIEWSINDNIKLETSYTYDKVRKNNILVGLRFSLPCGSNVERKVKESLLVTKVQRDIDIITTSTSNLTQNKVKQDRVIAIAKDDLADFNNPNKIDNNLHIIKILQFAYNNNATIIFAEEGEQFDYNSIQKIESSLFKEKVDQAVNTASSKLRQNISIAEVTDEASSEEDAFKRQVNILGAIIAEQKITGSNNFHIAGQQKSNVDVQNAPPIILPGNLNNKNPLPKPQQKNTTDDETKKLQGLFQLYARSPSTPNKKIYVDLPGHSNAEIERAGTLLLIEEGGQIYAVVGTDVNSERNHNGKATLPWNCWFSGQVEQRDNTIRDAIRRETFEESAGSVYISDAAINQAIQEQRFFYSPANKTLVIIHPDVSRKYNINQLSANLNNIKNDPTISKSMKEITTYHKVPIQEIISLQTRVKNFPSNNPHNPVYNVRSSTGATLRIQDKYAKVIGSSNIQALIKTMDKF